MERKRAAGRKRGPNGERDSGAKCWCCRKVVSLLCSHIGLCALVIGYSVFGAFVFRALEGPFERERAAEVISLRNLTVLKLWNITDKFNVLYKENWTAMVSKEIVLFQKQLIQAVREGYDGREVLAAKGPRQWSLSGAFLYSLTVITTIGQSSPLPSLPSPSDRTQRFANPRDPTAVPWPLSLPASAFGSKSELLSGSGQFFASKPRD